MRSCGCVCCKFKPHLLMILVQFLFSILYFITEASFIHGLNSYIYVTYLAGLVLLPFAYFLRVNFFFLLQKDKAKVDIGSFLGNLCAFFVGDEFVFEHVLCKPKIHYPTFATVLYNTGQASITFIIAVILWVEVINLRNPRSIAKIAGTSVSSGGIMIVTLQRAYNKKCMASSDSYYKNDHIHEEDRSLQLEAVYLGPSGTLCSLKRYPAELSLVTWMCLVGGAKSAVFTVMMEHNKSAWTIGFSVDLLSITYSGVVASGLFIFVQLWCTKEKGQVFVTKFNPLLTVLVAVLSYFVVGDKLDLGCTVGAIVVVIGLYLLIWDKEEEQEGDINSTKEQFKCNSDDPQKQDNRNPLDL